MLNIDSFSVQKDEVDLRDRIYQPNLVPLRAAYQAPSLTYAARNVGFPRDQGNEGTCVGYALAQLIDLENSLATRGKSELVSARMLQEMGRQLQPGPVGEEGTTLRAAIKGFYHFGVCREPCWPSGEHPVTTLSPVRAKDARARSLGAYFRVEPYLNDYHTALAEAGAILVSAMIHPGWDKDRLVDGQIVAPTIPEQGGGHAFVIVGYTDTGFLVLNSWGPDWGGIPGRDGKPIKGVALWSYLDWADSIMDAWVLRLGVSAETAFGISIGSQGLSGVSSSAAAPSTPAHRLVGHFAHLDDARFVRSGAYGSSLEAARQTFSYLAECAESPDPSINKYRAIMVIIAGSFFGIKDCVRHATELKNRIKPRGIYPYWLFWCNDFAEQTSAVLNQFMDDAFAQTGSQGDKLDELIEAQVHGIGRAFWRDIGRSSGRGGTAGPGAFEQLFALIGSRTYHRLHIIAEGAGALVLAELLEAGALSGLLHRIETVDLILPAIGTKRFASSFAPLLDQLNTKATDPGGWRIALHVAAPAVERNQSVGLYGRSLLHLVERAFQSPQTPDPTLLGRWAAAQKARVKWKAGRSPSLAVRAIPLEVSRNPRQSHCDLATAPALWASIIENAVASRNWAPQ